MRARLRCRAGGAEGRGAISALIQLVRAEGRRAARPGGAGARSGAGTRAGDDGAGSASDEEGGQGGAGEPPAPSGALVKSANCCLPLCCSHMRATFKHIGEIMAPLSHRSPCRPCR